MVVGDLVVVVVVVMVMTVVVMTVVVVVIVRLRGAFGHARNAQAALEQHES